MLFWALAGTMFTFLMTTLGAATVFFFRREITPAIQRLFLGFAAGVMIAASVWSLLIPAIEEAEESGVPGYLPATGGFILGVAFLLLLDKALPHLHHDDPHAPKTKRSKRTALLMIAMTLHNIPEGMAVGLAFARAAQNDGSFLWLSAAGALALGIGIQNFPEGAAIALPLRQEGNSRTRAFLEGCLSGSVEPIFGVLAAIVAGSVAPLMPWFLSFAAGAMMVVVVEELIPEARLDQSAHAGTLSVMFGFLLMMVLDVALG